MKAQPYRLETGGAIDRTKQISFSFAGKSYIGVEGDTLASALLANGVRFLGRSFKYHRPRGLIGAGCEESNSLVQLGSGGRSTPNMRATEIEIYDGLEANPVNCWPNLSFDVGGINNLFSKFLAAGFYYKTFMWPHWHVYEGFIRRAAGLGRASKTPDPDRYESRFAHCDIAIIGAGPAGLAAALAASAAGARVLVVEQNRHVGGSLRTDVSLVDNMPGWAWAKQAVDALLASPNVQFLNRTTAVGYLDHNALSLLESVGNESECAHNPAIPRYRLWQVRAREVILATGAIERPLVFSGNDRPNIMLARSARTYLSEFAVIPGRRAVVFTNNDDAYKTAAALAEAGGDVACVIDLRASVSPDLQQAMVALNIPVHTDAAIVATKGAKAVKAVQVCKADGSSQWIACDLVAMSGGFSPTVHLHCQSGGKLTFDEANACFIPSSSGQRQRSVGSAAGEFALGASLAQAHDAGLEAAARVGAASGREAPITLPDRVPNPLLPRWHVEGGKGKAFVDFQNDVSADDIALAARENFVSVEHLKRYTTLGMAADQGKTSNVNALAIMAALTGQTIEATGTTKYRFPFTPMPIGSFAGRTRGDLFRPKRLMPAHECHLALGAHFEDFGGWLRPSCYPRDGETHAAAEQREALAVRHSAGMFEGSPLGKIEVVGPDAAKFLDLIYTNTMSTLQPGKVRYGLMLSELGAIIDDGVAARLAEDRFLVCTSSAGAARISAWMEEWLQCEWLDLDVVVAPITTAWGVITLSGPKARNILEAIGSDIDLSADAFPHMTYREGSIGGFDVRVLRVSYTGELSYEINVAASQTEALWNRIATAGQAHDVTPVGVEGWMILRTEKGYLHIGGDTDGTTTPLDVGWGHVLKKKSDFVGRRSLTLPENARAEKLGFVGLQAVDNAVLPIGAHIVAKGPSGEDESDGYITSSAYSPTLNRGVALGMIRGGSRRTGDIVSVKTPTGLNQAKVVAPAAYDPEGDRLRG